MSEAPNEPVAETAQDTGNSDPVDKSEAKQPLEHEGRRHRGRSARKRQQREHPDRSQFASKRSHQDDFEPTPAWNGDLHGQRRGRGRDGNPNYDKLMMRYGTHLGSQYGPNTMMPSPGMMMRMPVVPPMMPGGYEEGLPGVFVGDGLPDHPPGMHMMLDRRPPGYWGNPYRGAGHPGAMAAHAQAMHPRYAGGDSMWAPLPASPWENYYLPPKDHIPPLHGEHPPRPVSPLSPDSEKGTQLPLPELEGSEEQSTRALDGGLISVDENALSNQPHRVPPSELDPSMADQGIPLRQPAIHSQVPPPYHSVPPMQQHYMKSGVPPEASSKYMMNMAVPYGRMPAYTYPVPYGQKWLGLQPGYMPGPKPIMKVGAPPSMMWPQAANPMMMPRRMVGYRQPQMGPLPYDYSSARPSKHMEGPFPSFGKMPSSQHKFMGPLPSYLEGIPTLSEEETYFRTMAIEMEKTLQEEVRSGNPADTRWFVTHIETDLLSDEVYKIAASHLSFLPTRSTKKEFFQAPAPPVDPEKLSSWIRAKNVNDISSLFSDMITNEKADDPRCRASYFSLAHPTLSLFEAPTQVSSSLEESIAANVEASKRFPADVLHESALAHLFVIPDQDADSSRPGIDPPSNTALSDRETRWDQFCSDLQSALAMRLPPLQFIWTNYQPSLPIPSPASSKSHLFWFQYTPLPITISLCCSADDLAIPNHLPVIFRCPLLNHLDQDSSSLMTFIDKRQDRLFVTNKYLEKTLLAIANQP